MDKLKAKAVVKPAREVPHLEIKLSEIVAAVNAGLNPGKPIINWFEGDPNGVAAVTIKDGEASVTNESVKFGGTIDGQTVSDLKVVAYKGYQGGVYADGAATDAVVDNAVIYCEDAGKGVGGPDTAVSARNNASLTIRNSVIDTIGKNRFCTTAEYGAKLRVYDSLIYAHGIPYGEGYAPVSGLMATPPPALEIGGNARAHCTMTNSYSYFYNSKIICEGWAALSTEGAEGFVYLEANDCDVICTKSGYGAYADPDCHDYFNRCNFDIAAMAAIIAGEGDMTFTDCDVKCGSYFALFHNVNGVPEEVGTMTVNGGSICCEKDVALVKSQNTILDLRGCEIKSGNGVLIHTILNDDPCRTIPNDHPYGNNVILTDMNVTGDCIHEDPEREMWIELHSTILNGAIKNANISIDAGSKWYATADSTVTLTEDVYVNQIDAPKGVTINAKGGAAGTYDLPSGGKLIIAE